MPINSARLKWAMMYLFAAVLVVTECRAELPRLSLYARMGGAANVTAVVGDVIDDAANDPHLKRSFADVDIPRVKRLLVEQICELAGGGCQYSGDSMHDVHAGLGITQAEFYNLVQVLRDSMIRHGIGLRERNELLKILAPMKRDVVEK
jgi:hemoglobin